MHEWPLPGELPDPNAELVRPAPLEPEPENFPFWGYGDVAFVTGMVFLGLVIITIGLFFWGSLIPKPVVLVVMQLAIYGPGILAMYGAISLRYGKPFGRSIRWGSSSASLGYAVVAGVLAAVGAGLLGAALGAQGMEDLPIKEMLSTPTLLAIVGVFAVTLGPLWEELTFRGFLMPLVAKTTGNAMAVVLTATAFAAMHGQEYGWGWRELSSILFAGICFGVARVVTGSTGFAVAMHAMYNLTVFAALLAQGGLPGGTQ